MSMRMYMYTYMCIYVRGGRNRGLWFMAIVAAVRGGPGGGRSAYWVSPARRPTLTIAGTPIEPAHSMVPGRPASLWPRFAGRRSGEMAFGDQGGPDAPTGMQPTPSEHFFSHLPATAHARTLWLDACPLLAAAASPLTRLLVRVRADYSSLACAGLYSEPGLQARLVTILAPASLSQSLLSTR